MVTTSQVNKAGKVLRAWFLGPNNALSESEHRALDVLTGYRAEHAEPLIKANNGLRSMLRTEGCAVDVSQRLKRTATILEKLARQPSMALSTMQDIGGCRAILANIKELRRVEKRVAKRRPPVRLDDYASNPRESGYRAVHIVVRYDDRCVEIQLRTRLMHDWAVAVERLGAQLDEDLKSGSGPRALLVWLEAIAEALAIEDRGEVVDNVLSDRISQLRIAALPFLPGGTR